MAKLTNQKWEKAAQVYVETGNKTQAYKQAGYSTNMSDKAISANVNRLFSRDLVLTRVSELQKHHQQRHDVTVDSITQELEEAMALATVLGKPSALVAAIMGKAKLHGLIVDKLKSSVTLQDKTDDELDQALQALGIDPASLQPTHH